MHWSRRIAFKLALMAVLIAFGVGMIMSTAQIYIDYHDEVQLLRGKVTKSLEQAENAASRAVFNLDDELALEVISGLMQYDYIISARILDEEGVERASLRRARVELPGSYSMLRGLFNDILTFEYELELDEPIVQDPGYLIVEVDEAAGLAPFFTRSVTHFVSSLFRVLVLVILLYLLFYRGLTRPLSSIVEQVSDINPEQPGERRLIIPKNHDLNELGLLSKQINMAFDATQILLDNLRATNRALTASEEALRRRSWELENEVERTKRTTEELIATKEEAEAANRAKSVFLANVSHELRTPLNAIIGFASMMEEGIFGKIEHEKYRQYLKDIMNSGEHLSEILSEILDLAKIEAGQVDMDEQEVSVAELCEEAASIVQTNAKKNKTDVVLELEDNLPNLYCDNVKIRQVLINLLSNAIKFTPTGAGDITIRAGVKSSRAIYIAIADRGIGIPSEEQEIIFSPFMRSASAFSRSYEGTGLGLSLVKAFMDKHDGQVTLESQVDEGSVFTLHFPPTRSR